MPCDKLLAFLADNRVDFELVEHPEAYTAQDVAFKSGVSGRAFAKTVLVKIDGEMAMAVLPAQDKVDFSLLQVAAGAQTICLALEDEFSALFPDCEIGAMPPFGNLYGMNVFIAGSLLRTERITFNAGTHTEVLTLPFADFQALVAPQTAHFSFRPLLERKATG